MKVKLQKDDQVVEDAMVYDIGKQATLEVGKNIHGPKSKILNRSVSLNLCHAAKCYSFATHLTLKLSRGSIWTLISVFTRKHKVFSHRPLS